MKLQFAPIFSIFPVVFAFGCSSGPVDEDSTSLDDIDVSVDGSGGDGDGDGAQEPVPEPVEVVDNCVGGEDVCDVDCASTPEGCGCDSLTEVWDGAACVANACGSACGVGQFCDQGSGACAELCVPDRTAGDFEFCVNTDNDSLGMVVTYTGEGTLDVASSQIRLNGAEIDVSSLYDEASQTFTVYRSGLRPSKYSYLFRMKDSTGGDIQPLFVPTWVGDGMRYREFTWRDGIVYQVFTDRFLNADPTNDLDNSAGSLTEVTDARSQWQGGDFAGITAKIRDGYFESMGINALWISSPILNSHNSQPAVETDRTDRFASYHSYHPIATGYTHLNNYGYDNPIESAFGTQEELHELVNEAHARGIRIIPDFVANHVQIEAAVYQQHPEWFFGYNACHNRWDEGRISCWFTSDMPDFDYGANPAAVQMMTDHAVWMVQEFNFDGFRADALKHMDDVSVRALKTAIVEQVETTVNNHDLSEEPTVFYMVGESLGGWARYHVRADMVQGQVDEEYYRRVKDALLSYNSTLSDLANFAIPNDTAYLSAQPNNGGSGGYPGAVMGNFFGNHDQWRALTEAGGTANGDSYKRLRMAQAFLMTSPLNIPMLYQGDDIGTEGQQDPDNRAMQKFDELHGLSSEEAASLVHMQKAGKLREQYAPLRHGTRETVELEDYFWVYKVSYQGEDVYVAINRDADKSYSPPAGYIDGLDNCSGGVVPSQTACVFVVP